MRPNSFDIFISTSNRTGGIKSTRLAPITPPLEPPRLCLELSQKWIVDKGLVSGTAYSKMPACNVNPMVNVLGMVTNSPIEKPQTRMGPDLGNVGRVRGGEEVIFDALLDGSRRSPRQVKGENGEVQRDRPRSSSTPVDDGGDRVRMVGSNKHVAEVVVEVDDVAPLEVVILGAHRRLNHFKERPGSTVELS